MISRAKAKTFEQDLDRQIEGAKREAENIIKSAQIDAAAETIKKQEKFTSEANRSRAELHETEMRLTKREDTLDRQAEMLQQREGAEAAATGVRQEIAQHWSEGETTFCFDGPAEESTAKNQRNEH